MCDRVVILGAGVPIVSDDVPYALKQYAMLIGGVRGAREL